MKQTILLFIVIFSLNTRGEGISTGSYEDDRVLNLVRSHTRGGIVWLGSGKKTFLSLYEESTGEEKLRAAIVLHSMGMHADWPELISPLRMKLPEQGWASLSVQLPLLDPQTGLAEYGNLFGIANERIRTAVRYLQDKGYGDIVIIGYSFGATSAVNYLTNYSSSVKAMVGISMQPHPFLKPRYNLVDALTGMDLPTLDIYAGQDFSGVLRSTDDRRLSARKGRNPVYAQIMVNGANHYFTGMEDQLVSNIVNWLDGVLKGQGENLQ
jgi:predicted alpha/beta-hydrolase family hydrolase